MIDNNYAIYVFSFNRAEFLENCINSIESLTNNIDVFVVDDNSDDIDTIELLGRLSGRFEILANARTSEQEFKTGGLAGSMNVAINHARDGGYDFVIFIQDDMQFVRSLRPEDTYSIKNYFDRVQNSVQISTTFIRRLSADTFLDDHSICLESGAYIREKSAERGKSNFSAAGVFHVARFHKLFQKFEVGEEVNSAKARRLDLTCGRSIYPFLCWLPYPLSYRGKKKSIGHMLFETLGRSGYYPIDIMTNSAAEQLLTRNPTVLPVMEDFLVAPNSPRSDIWSTGGGEYNFIAIDSVFTKIFSSLRIIKAGLVNGLQRK